MAKGYWITFYRSVYPPAEVYRVLHDGDEVSLGGEMLVAHLTPGHTKGCTTWTMKVTEGGKTYNVVIVGSPNDAPHALVVFGDLRIILVVDEFVNPGYIEVVAMRYFSGRPRQLLRSGTEIFALERRSSEPVHRS